MTQCKQGGALAHYPNISDHGFIGDLQTAALVATDGTVDWFCCPRFDSPSVFASLLDADKGGFCRIAPDRDDYVTRQLYLPDTAILVTRFMTPDGVGEVHDFMPVIEGPATRSHRLVRNIRVVRGVMRFAIEIQPRFDYGRKPHELTLSEDGGVFRSNDLELTVHGIAPKDLDIKKAGITPEPAGDGVRWTRTLRAGEAGGVVLESMGGHPRRVTPEEAQQLADDTARFWRSWLCEAAYNRPGGGGGRPVGHDAQADDLRADRGPGRGAHRRAARAGRRRAELGLPLHLDPGRLFLHLRAARARLPGGGRRVRPLAAGPRGRAGGQRVRSAQDHVPGGRQLGPDRGDPRPLRGMARLAPGADRQRRRRPATARHLRRGRRRPVPRRQQRHRARLSGLDLARQHDGLALRALGPAGRGHLGNPRRPTGLHLRPVPGVGGV